MGLLACNLLCVVAGLICLSGVSTLPFPLNITMEMSGDGPELGLIFPTVRTTHVPSPVTPTKTVNTIITTTIIRLKDFVFNQVADVLKENLLLFTVVTSLLIVIIFIICCASAMSHKRKLDTFYPPAKKYPPRTYMDHGVQSKEFSPQSTSVVAKKLRTPSKALVGPKEGKDPRPKPLEVLTVQEVEEVDVDMHRDEPKPKAEPKSTNQNSQPVMCTCHFRKINH